MCFLGFWGESFLVLSKSKDMKNSESGNWVFGFWSSGVLGFWGFGVSQNRRDNIIFLEKSCCVYYIVFILLWLVMLCSGCVVYEIVVQKRAAKSIYLYFFPRPTSEGFLFSSSSARAKMSFPGFAIVCGRIETLEIITPNRLQFRGAQLFVNSFKNKWYVGLK